MSLDPDIYDEMHRLPFSDETADRLLAGRLSPEDAPPAGRDLAVLFASATSAPTPDELLHRDHVVAAGVAAVLSSAPLPEPTPPRRRSMLSKILTAKVAAAATIAAFGLGTAAAAAVGSLPGQNHANSHAATGLAIAASHPSTAGDTATPAGGSLPPTGPANVHAQWGLCTGFLAAQKSTTSSTSEPPQYSSTAFKALIAEHGGIAATTTYCKSLAHPGSNKPDTSTNADTPEGSGKPANPGNSAGKGNSQSANTPPTSTGKPSSTGRPATHGTSTASVASNGASGAGSANATPHP
jgi:hypothetical protein